MSSLCAVYRFRPVLKERLWGGTRLRDLLGRPAVERCRIGESWELFAFGNESSELVAPTAALHTLHDLLSLGYVRVAQNGTAQPGFPLLFKWLDAAMDLSVQVHPPDGHPLLAKGTSGKTECWVVLDAERDAKVYIGLERPLSSGDIAALSRTGEIAHYLRWFRVQPGDVFFIPAGTVHALGAGVMVAEVQQASDVTYRLYDWQRVDPATGRPRELHIEQAAACVRQTSGGPVRPRLALSTDGLRVEKLITRDICQAFELSRVFAARRVTVRLQANWAVWMVMQGRGLVDDGRNNHTVKQGDTLLVSGPGTCRVVPADGSIVLLETRVPDEPLACWYAE